MTCGETSKLSLRTRALGKNYMCMYTHYTCTSVCHLRSIDSVVKVSGYIVRLWAHIHDFLPHLFVCLFVILSMMIAISCICVYMYVHSMNMYV